VGIWATSVDEYMQNYPGSNLSVIDVMALNIYYLKIDAIVMAPECPEH
jgi:hypothetical protein